MPYYDYITEIGEKLDIKESIKGYCPIAEIVLYCRYGKTIEPKAALPFLVFSEGSSSPPDERKEGDSMVTYSDLIQTGIFIVALVGFCFTIFKGKKK